MEVATATNAVVEERRTVLTRRPTEEEVWDALVLFTAKHGVQLKRRLEYAVGDDAEDVYQDTLISVMKALPSAALDPSQLPSYIYRAAYRAATRRAQRNGKTVSIDAFGDEDLPDRGVAESDERADQFEKMAQFGEAIEKLPIKERRALLMRSAGQMKVKDVAEIMGEDYRHTRYMIDHAAKSVESHLHMASEGQLCSGYGSLIRQSVFSQISMSERMRLRTHLSYCSSCRKARALMLDDSRTAKMMVPPVLFLPFAEQLHHFGNLHSVFDTATVFILHLAQKVNNLFAQIASGSSDAAGATVQSVVVVVIAATATAGTTTAQKFDIDNLGGSLDSAVSAVGSSVESVSKPQPSSTAPVSMSDDTVKPKQGKEKKDEQGKVAEKPKQKDQTVEKASKKSKQKSKKAKQSQKKAEKPKQTSSPAAVSPSTSPAPAESTSSSGSGTGSNSQPEEVTEGGAEEFGP